MEPRQQSPLGLSTSQAHSLLCTRSEMYGTGSGSLRTSSPVASKQKHTRSPRSPVLYAGGRRTSAVVRVVPSASKYTTSQPAEGQQEVVPLQVARPWLLRMMADQVHAHASPRVPRSGQGCDQGSAVMRAATPARTAHRRRTLMPQAWPRVRPRQRSLPDVQASGRLHGRLRPLDKWPRLP